MLKSILIGVAASTALLTSCVSHRSGNLAQTVQHDARSVQYDQIRLQIARSYDHPYDIPSLALLSSAVTQSTNALKGSFSHEVAPSGITNTTGFDLGEFSDQAILTVNVTSGATAIEGMRDLYAYAARGDNTWEKSIGPILFNKPPKYPWLYRSTGALPVECPPQTCYQITKIGNFVYWAKTERDFSNFVLAVLEASTLSRDNSAAPSGKGGKKAAAVHGGLKRNEQSAPSNTILVVPNATQ
ncbi:hypothetical protein [Rhizobium sp. BR 362]|uniref:hypothetical protein n=1 Tax=Rhizobium sp. BR 362 TaxID=3040670 RepID=UPI002F400B81